MADKRQCRETAKTTGEPCRMPPLEGSDYCWIHDPEKTKERTAARKLGGHHRKRSKVAEVPEGLDLSTVEGVQQLLEVAATDLLACDNGVSRSRALSYIASVALKARETAALEDEIAEIKALLSGRGVPNA